MDEHKIIEFISNDNEFVKAFFEGHFSNSNKILNFCKQNKIKIKSKISHAKTNEDKMDIIVELEGAFLFLENLDCNVVYEPEKNINNIDYKVTFNNSDDVFLEIKHIRETEPGKKIGELEEYIKSNIKKVPSQLALSLTFTERRLLSKNYEQLFIKREKIVKNIASLIKQYNNNLSDNDRIEIKLSDFEKEIDVTISKPPLKKDKTYTSWYGSSKPVFYTQKEHLKFVDLICSSLSQLVPFNNNILFVISYNTTHDKNDLKWAMNILQEKIKNDNDEFFILKDFQNCSDFKTKLLNLSCIIFKPGSYTSHEPRNEIWLNPLNKSKLINEITDRLENLTFKYHRPIIGF